ncbi:hypothetical protein BASA50_004738 [Batrachochytrium salamandrivorans]|uniref:Phosphoribulokinase/uridine kinase domain-containing protein n=1 Tax=Batrachochytrium salamandrivorans TaxID=1357716 RepID=A0ABQ8FF65_9FUNG|nr:hypothetical protein BASA62_009457 [Batrachochytrium salamandrivorans]KAH6563482.1 hypothetical protein BASA60_010692 [Batrachochytrium salamandrivorans]KAH6590752.1 hypothetical protein BASA61_005173 [Batrachochytrium salamandrivorans]KAH6596980.1 hypothetical protein BASA50_004738 [Batrachochytrium salamandrivorans]KAH9273477.1 hypothetical protein BASA83_004143 [Batrachochytrium salamandrivorans]
MSVAVKEVVLQAICDWHRQHRLQGNQPTDASMCIDKTAQISRVGGVEEEMQHAFHHPPLLVGISGPQGSGKTTLVQSLVDDLQQTAGIRAVALSADDLYLPYTEQMHLASLNKTNPLLQYRGLPGTHSISLGHHILSGLSAHNNNPIYSPIHIPIYNKALKGGRGDRLPQSDWTAVTGHVDVVLFEGWFLGFKPCSPEQVSSIWCSCPQSIPCPSERDNHDPLPSSRIINNNNNYSCQNIDQIMAFLSDYEQQWYPHIDVFVHLAISDLSFIYDWRWEQEKSMQDRQTALATHAEPVQNGLNRSQINDFVDRFMPIYKLCLPRLVSHGFFEDTSGLNGCGMSRSLQIWLDSSRQIVSHKYV